MRPRCSLTVDDLFGRLAPLVKQIYETPECSGPLVGHQPWVYLSDPRGPQ